MTVSRVSRADFNFALPTLADFVILAGPTSLRNFGETRSHRPEWSPLPLRVLWVHTLQSTLGSYTQSTVSSYTQSTVNMPTDKMLYECCGSSKLSWNNKVRVSSTSSQRDQTSCLLYQELSRNLFVNFLQHSPWQQARPFSMVKCICLLDYPREHVGTTANILRIPSSSNISISEYDHRLPSTTRQARDSHSSMF